MERVGVRELRQHASRWLKRVQAGETFEVTDRGRPIAVLAPLPSTDSAMERLVRSGEVRPPTSERSSRRRHRIRSGASASEVLSDLRAEDDR